ncbi:hypothetical protein DOTSEDRAFT_55316 [Dothistroma septosporum NZE10]|uniref:NAD(P)-binding protein n=1 Tax=Dothistroma septosporum (strain NZE10 / CBS 128990) TaxID=675120 RepID=N1PH93_DOTSN|nr:hypothetical protein DOTSEDRAFT_55316 [Dothistroma septosporum NZE10]
MTTPSSDLERAQQIQKALLQGTAKMNREKPLDYSTLAKKTTVVTGGGSGIGRGIVDTLRSHGAMVAVLDLIWPSVGSDEGHSVNMEGVQFFECDVSSWDSLLRAFQHVMTWSNGQLDAVIMSAGLRSHNIKDLLRNSSAAEVPQKPPSAVFDVNLLGTYYTTYLALWYFARRKADDNEAEGGWKPQLLFLGSLASYVEQPLSTDYCASKHGVRGLWKSIRAHGASFGGCQMNMLAPTLINTRKGLSKTRAGGLSGYFKLGEVEDVVAGALRCLCDAEMDGRALCCVRGEEGDAGCHNFDLCDNILDVNGGERVLENFRNGIVASLG